MEQLIHTGARTPWNKRKLVGQLLGSMVGLLSAEPEKTRVTPLSGKCLAVGRDQLAQRGQKVTRPDG